MTNIKLLSCIYFTKTTETEVVLGEVITDRLNYSPNQQKHFITEELTSPIRENSHTTDDQTAMSNKKTRKKSIFHFANTSAKVERIIIKVKSQTKNKSLWINMNYLLNPYRSVNKAFLSASSTRTGT